MLLTMEEKFLFTGRLLYNYSYAGKSRSSAIIISYLIKEWQMSLEGALKLVVGKRPVAAPNAGFIKQLEEFSYEISLDNIKTAYIIIEVDNLSPN